MKATQLLRFHAMWRSWLDFAVLAACVSVAGCVRTAPVCTTVSADYEPQILYEACPTEFPARTECGFLRVAERPATLSCGLELAWVRYTPPGSSSDPPLFVLGGGPGDPLVARISDVIARIGQAAPGRVLIVHDPRGVGASSPALDCRDVPAEDVSSQDEWLATCAREYRRRGHDPSAYRTTILADDLRALATALAYPTFDLLGVSYGSRLAQSVARSSPSRVRSLVLDAATPSDAPLLETLATNLDRASRRLFESCEESSECSERGAIADDHAELLRSLREEPVPIVVHGQGVSLGPSLYLSVLSSVLGRGNLLPVAPAMIREAVGGDYSAFEYLLEQLEPPPTAYFMHYAIMCAEELPRNERETAIADLAVLPDYAPALPYDGIAAACAAMEIPPAPPDEESPIDVPTLVATGRFDPLSPDVLWDRVRQLVPRGTFVDLPTGHGTVGDTCGQQTIEAFLSDPERFTRPECAEAPAFVQSSREFLRTALPAGEP